MGHSQASKAANRNRIIGAAAARLRRDGPEALSIAALMDAAGLTHGGFYRHFATRDALLAAALAEALAQAQANTGWQGADGTPDLRRLVRGYLSPRHRDAPASGCAIAALAGEASRDAALRPVMAPFVESFLDGVAGKTQDPARAALITSALVGALTLARVLPPEQSDALLQQVQEQLLALASD